MSIVTDAEIQRLRELCNEATKGPWVQLDDDASSTSPLSYLRDANQMHICYAEGEITIQNNLPFIVAARTALPAVLDALVEARKRIEYESQQYIEANNDRCIQKAANEVLLAQLEEAKKALRGIIRDLGVLGPDADVIGIASAALGEEK